MACLLTFRNSVFCLAVVGLCASLCYGAERVLLPGAPQKAVEWRYTFEKPARDWPQMDFDDCQWKQGPAGFGTPQTPDTTVGTTWSTRDIWLRTDFQYDGSPFEKAAVNLYHDEDATVYLNGQKILERAWFVPRYELHNITEAAKKYLRAGRNVLAATCYQTQGGQYIDVGIVLDPKQELFAPEQLPLIKPLFDYPVRDTSICVGRDGNFYLTGTTGYPTWSPPVTMFTGPMVLVIWPSPTAGTTCSSRTERAIGGRLFSATTREHRFVNGRPFCGSNSMTKVE